MTAAISVSLITDDDPSSFEVIVREPSGETHHLVTLSRRDHARLAQGHSAQDLIEAAFRFLLERESKEDILERFDLSVIARYFPDFEKRLPRYL